jgi:hypothetical protein
MPVIFGNAISVSATATTTATATRKNEVDNADANFYSTVRQTIQGLDRLIDNILFSGSTFLLAFLGVAGILYKQDPIMLRGVDAARHGAWMIALGAFFLAWALLLRLRLYVNFLDEAVGIAKRIETCLLEEDFRLTHKFQGKWGAGKGGWRVLVFFPFGGILVSFVALCFFLYTAFCPPTETPTPPAPPTCPPAESKIGQ